MKILRHGMLINLFIALIAITTFVVINMDGNHRLALLSSLIIFITLTLLYNSYFYYPIIKRYRFYLQYKNDEWFDTLNDEGEKMGRAPRTVCHNGSMLLHPVVHVHIINSEGQLLLQKRALTKKIQPGKWDTSVGGHIASGEPLEEAIFRETLEELGIKLEQKSLIPVKKYIFQSSIEREYVYSYVYRHDGPIDFQKEEIDEVAFFTIPDIERLIERGECTENFIKEYLMIRDGYLV